MGARRFELRTSPLSGVRSSQLSYAPVFHALEAFILHGVSSESTPCLPLIGDLLGEAGPVVAARLMRVRWRRWDRPGASNAATRVRPRPRVAAEVRGGPALPHGRRS